MAYLSRKELEDIARDILRRYKKRYLPTRYLCYSVDPTQLTQMLGISIEYGILSDDATLLGVTSAGPVWVDIFDDTMHTKDFLLDGNTILVEKRLMNNPRNYGRLNFTIAHEIGHQILYRIFPEDYGIYGRSVYSYRGHNPNKIEDWTEWQADSLAAALLMPEDAVKDGMFCVGLGDKMKVLSKRYSQYNYERFCELANLLGVSRTALSFRMEQLGLLERNNLIYQR